MARPHRLSRLFEIAMAMIPPTLIVGVLWPPGGSRRGCYFGPSSYVFVTRSADGALECRTVCSEIEARPTHDDWHGIEEELEAAAAYMLPPFTYGVRARGTFADWRWTVATRRDVYPTGDERDVPTERIHEAVDAFIRDATLPRDDILGINTEEDRQLLLAAWRHPSGTASRFDTVALITNAAGWLGIFALLTLGGWTLVIAVRHNRRLLALSCNESPCPFCRYDLRGLPDDAPCPECGRPTEGRPLADA